MTNENRLFPGTPCFLTGSLEAAGFYELELPDGFRWVKPKAVCRFWIDGEAACEKPCLLIRATARQGAWATYLAPSVDGRRLGVHLIPGYGTYFFALPAALLAGRSAGDSLEIELRTFHGIRESSRDDPRDLALAIYELRIIDLNTDGFPERQYFLDQIKIFEPAGGLAAEILGSHVYRRTDRILDVGAGAGWTTLLLAGFSGANVWGIDLYDYTGPDRLNFKTDLLERFDRHRPVLQRISRFAALADLEVLKQALGRCTFLTMNAEEMLFPDDSFDFVFSLNAFEHIGRPDDALAEIRRVLRPGGQALLRFSPLYHSDSGSHLPACTTCDRPWAHLLMTREEIKEAIRRTGSVPNEVDSILDSLNGWKPAQFTELFERSGLRVLSRGIDTGFTLMGAEHSPEFAELLHRFSQEDLTTYSMLWHLEKPIGRFRLSSTSVF